MLLLLETRHHLLSLEQSIEDEGRIRQLIWWERVRLLDTPGIRRKRPAHVGNIDVVIRAIGLPEIMRLADLRRRWMRQIVIQKFDGQVFEEGLDCVRREKGEHR